VARFISVFRLRVEDGQRRWWVVDTKPSDTAKSGTVIAELMGEGMALRIATALNGMGAAVDDDPDPLTPWPAAVPPELNKQAQL
jgi:hypothetical protein